MLLSRTVRQLGAGIHRSRCGTRILSITFGPIVGDAKHLAVLGRTFAALAPCCNVVGVHFVKFIDPALVRAVPNRAERAVGLALALSCLRLLSVCGPLDRCVEDPDLQQLRIDRAA